MLSCRSVPTTTQHYPNAGPRRAHGGPAAPPLARSHVIRCSRLGASPCHLSDRLLSNSLDESRLSCRDVQEYQRRPIRLATPGFPRLHELRAHVEIAGENRLRRVQLSAHLLDSAAAEGSRRPRKGGRPQAPLALRMFQGLFHRSDQFRECLTLHGCSPQAFRLISAAMSRKTRFSPGVRPDGSRSRGMIPSMIRIAGTAAMLGVGFALVLSAAEVRQSPAAQSRTALILGQVVTARAIGR